MDDPFKQNKAFAIYGIIARLKDCVKRFLRDVTPRERAFTRATNAVRERPGSGRGTTNDASFDGTPVGAALMALATLPKAFQQHPWGGLGVVVLLILGMVFGAFVVSCWAVVNLVKYLPM